MINTTLPSNASKGKNIYYGSDKVTTNINSVPEGTKVIYERMFYQNLNLTDLIIPNGVTTIERFAFQYCKNLRSITIPNSVTDISLDAFNCCYNLKNIIAPHCVIYWAHSAPRVIPIKATLPFSLTKPSKPYITKVIIPHSLNVIEKETFNYCTQLEEVII